MNKTKKPEIIKPSIYQSNLIRLQSFLTHRCFSILSSGRNGSIEDQIRQSGLGYLLVKSSSKNEEVDGYLLLAGENESETRLKSFLRHYNSGIAVVE